MDNLRSSYSCRARRQCGRNLAMTGCAFQRFASRSLRAAQRLGLRQTRRPGQGLSPGRGPARLEPGSSAQDTPASALGGWKGVNSLPFSLSLSSHVYSFTTPGPPSLPARHPSLSRHFLALRLPAPGPPHLHRKPAPKSRPTTIAPLTR